MKWDFWRKPKDPWMRDRPPMPEPEIQLALGVQARAEYRRSQNVLSPLLKRAQRPERTLRYLIVMGRREITHQREHLSRSETRILQLEQALDLAEDQLHGPRA